MSYPVDYTKIKTADDWHYAQRISMIRAGDFENLPEELLPENLVKWFREETEQFPFGLRMKMGAAAEYIEKQDGIIKAYQEIIRKLSQERREQENPKPLTIDDLQQMHGEPVYIKGLGWRVNHGVEVFMNKFYMYTGIDARIEVNGRLEFYRHKPKEET